MKSKKPNRESFVAVAGNLEYERPAQPIANFGFGSAVPDPDLMAEIQNQLVSNQILSAVNTRPFVFLKNPYDDYHVKRHAEMQLTR